MSKHKELSEEDQERVNRYLSSGYNKTERRSFKPLVLFLVLVAVVWAIGAGAAMITKLAGIEA